MQKQNKTTQFLTFSLIIVCLFCVGIFGFLMKYINRQSEETINQVGDIYMESINERISKHFETMVDLRLTQLDTLVETLPVESNTDSKELREWLEYSSKARGFESLAYYFDDGSFEMIYGEQVKSLNPEPFLESMKNGERKVSVGIDKNDERVAVMGVPFKMNKQDGKVCIALVGKLPLEYISETLSLGDKDTLVYSFVIRKDGSYVVRGYDSTRDNYFNRIRALYEELNGKGAEQLIAEIQTAMENEEDYVSMINVFGERRQLYCSTLPRSEWYLVTVMPYGTLNKAVEDLGNRSLNVFIGSCALILLALLLLFLKYFSMNRAQMKEIDEARQMAEKASRSKGEFLSNMSHDIRTPMNAIVGMNTIAMANIDDPQRVQDCLKKISLSSKHLLGLINDVLDMSKIESGKMTLNVELVSLREAMDSIISIIQPQVKEKQQKFNVFIYNISSENVRCDSVRLNQVLLNLLSNAVKFTPEGGSITVALHEEESPKGKDFVRIQIQVKDDGIGMSEEFQNRIFDSFSREDSKRVQKTEGTGLGMAITKYIVDAMGGEIKVISRQGEGSEFCVTLDFEKAAEQEETMVLPDMTMLVVDDDRQLCESTVASLNSIGIHSEWAMDGETAVQMVKQHHSIHKDYHVILLDWKLPGMDGIKTARELRRQLGEEVPILLISAYDCSEIEAEARAAGVSGFLSKPLFRSTLYYGLKPYTGVSDDTSISEKTEIDFSGRRILVAEDNELNWEIASELLQDLGLKLEWAENGQICVDMFGQSEVGFYDAILMDIRMPIMNGYEAADLIRKMDRPDASIPIIAMTADAFSEDIQRCLEHGMNAHTAKPIDVREVSRILERCLDRQN